MNCKQGDIAVVLRSQVPGNVFKLVTCLRLLPATEYLGERGHEVGQWFYPAGQFTGPVWLVEPLGSLFAQDILSGAISPVTMAPVADRDLRPLRDTDEPDQMPRVTDKELTA